MMMKEAYKKIEQSAKFKEFSKKYPNNYLAHVFITKEEDKGVEGNWQFGFFDAKTDRIIIFEVDKEVVEHPPQEVYKQPDHKIASLDIGSVKFTFQQALEKAKEQLRLKYKGELATKYIVILQNIQEHGTVWNITLLSTSFHVINFKIGAGSGEMKAESRESLTTWKKDD